MGDLYTLYSEVVGRILFIGMFVVVLPVIIGVLLMYCRIMLSYALFAYSILFEVLMFIGLGAYYTYRTANFIILEIRELYYCIKIEFVKEFKK